MTAHLGGMREPHWCLNTDELQCHTEGAVQIMVSNVGPQLVTIMSTPAASAASSAAMDIL